jgi:hypothetical protein
MKICQKIPAQVDKGQEASRGGGRPGGGIQLRFFRCGVLRGLFDSRQVTFARTALWLTPFTSVHRG